ncbi:MAG: hypothetical protein WBH04_12745 [Albidovulum sp.]
MHFAKPLTALKVAGIATLYTFATAAVALAAGLPAANPGSGAATFDAAYGSDNAKMRLAAAYTASADAEALSDIRPLRYSHGATPSEIRPLRYSHGAAPADIRPLRYSHGATPSEIRPLRYSHGATPADIRPLRYSHGATPSEIRPLRYARNKTAEATLQLADNSDL